MAGILGKAPDQYVQNQIEVRQSTHGSGILNGRTSEQIVFLNGNTSWIKLASAVSVSDSVLSNAGLESSLVGIELAKQNVLFGGTAAFDKSTNTTFQREGNTSYEFSEFGFVPMAGITDVSIKSLNRGSLKKAKVQIIAHSKRQFEIISILYMRLGYTVMLEWGNTYFLNDDYELQRIENTIIEDLFFDNAYKQSYVPIINAIPVKREKYHANYDGILGAVNNFDWSFKDDGSYEINLEILSLGDIIESTVSNVTPTLDLVNYVKFVEAIFPEFQGYDIDNSVISNALSLWKYFDTAPSNQGRTLDKLHIVLTDGTQAEVGSFLPNDDGSNAQATTGSGVALGVPIQQQWNFKYRGVIQTQANANSATPIEPVDLQVIRESNPDYYFPAGIYNPGTYPDRVITSNQYSNTFKVENFVGISGSGSDLIDQAKQYMLKIYKENYKNPTATISDIKETSEGSFFTTGAYPNISEFYPQFNNRTFYILYTVDQDGSDYPLVLIEGQLIDERVPPAVDGASVANAPVAPTVNPINAFAKNSAIKISTTTPQYYLRFGELLKYMTDYIVPVINAPDKPPLLKIAYGKDESMMYCLPISVSLDPKVCVVRNDNFTKSSGKAAQPYKELEEWKDTSNENKAYPANIYLNFDFIISCLSSTTDERGSTNIFDFINEICTGLNKALGGVNNLSPVVIEGTNTIKLIDATPIPKEITPDSNVIIQLFGFNGTKAESNFVRDVSLKTAISSEFATIATVGATAKGYVKGSEGIAFSKLNEGLKDRFNPGLKSPDPLAKDDEAETNYEEDFIKWVTLCYGFSGDISKTPPVVGEAKDDIIKKNVSIVTEYYKYLLAKQSSKQSGTIGFIPFKLSYNTDGISGFNIYDKLTIDSRFFPKEYGNALDFIVTGINHKLKNNDWETEIETTVIGKSSQATIPERVGKEVVNAQIEEPVLPGYNGAPTDIVTAGGTGPKSLGTYGTAGPQGPVSPDALTIATIDQIVTNSGTTNELRKRIVKIAASYVGQRELPGRNVGFYDPKFLANMKRPKQKWYIGAMWCNFFTDMVWYEAYTVGNALVPAASSTYQDIWKNKLGNGEWGKPLTPACFTTYNKFAAKGLAISIAEAKAGTKLPEPGDMVVYSGSHIEIVVATKIENGKLTEISTIGGNTGTDVRDGGLTLYKPSIGLGSLHGFCKVIF